MTGRIFLTPAPRAPLPSWLESDLHFDPEGLLRFCVGGRPVGWMLPALAQRLTRWPEVFSVGQDRVDFAPGLDAAATRSLAIAEVLQRLREEQQRLLEEIAILRAVAMHGEKAKK